MNRSFNLDGTTYIDHHAGNYFRVPITVDYSKSACLYQKDGSSWLVILQPLPAINNVGQLCGSKIGGYTWQNKCFLRYENYSFFTELDTDWNSWLNETDIVTTNLTNFRVTTSNLLTNLSDQAIEPANKGFAQGSTIYPSIGTIYGLVQCLRELSLRDCRSCLQLATRYFSFFSMKILLIYIMYQITTVVNVLQN